MNKKPEPMKVDEEGFVYVSMDYHKNIIFELQEKYNKALQLLSEYNMPCEIDNFMDKNTDYCSINCSCDEEIYKKCWDLFITQKIKESD